MDVSIRLSGRPASKELASILVVLVRIVSNLISRVLFFLFHSVFFFRLYFGHNFFFFGHWCLCVFCFVFAGLES